MRWTGRRRQLSCSCVRSATWALRCTRGAAARLHRATGTGGFTAFVACRNAALSVCYTAGCGVVVPPSRFLWLSAAILRRVAAAWATRFATCWLANALSCRSHLLARSRRNCVAAVSGWRGDQQSSLPAPCCSGCLEVRQRSQAFCARKKRAYTVVTPYGDARRTAPKRAEEEAYLSEVACLVGGWRYGQPHFTSLSYHTLFYSPVSSSDASPILPCVARVAGHGCCS